MTSLVPFDDSELAAAALVRADEYAEAMDQDVTVLSVVPESKRYARETERIAAGAAFDPYDLIGELRQAAAALAPGASFRVERVDASAAAGTVPSTIRRVANDVAATVVFLGSENAGRIVVPVSSVGGSVAADASYDVHLVRRRAPPRIESIRGRSEFSLTE